jgi:SAM-dependent MidA family methyltransferase
MIHSAERHAVPWAHAWREASRGFWAKANPSEHFRTSAGPQVAHLVADIVKATDERLGHPEDFIVLDIGCADGELLELVRERSPGLRGRARWVGVDIRPFDRRGVTCVMADCPTPIPGSPFVGVVMAHEWLDEIPCDIVERDDHGVDRIVMVDRYGVESLGPALSDDVGCAGVGIDGVRVREWLSRWWPLRNPGDRAEVGMSRDQAWSWMGALLVRGTALVTDYGHDRDSRIGAGPGGSLVGYRSGRLVRPVPDGSCGLTAHVALDSCAATLPGTSVSRQRDEIPQAELSEHPGTLDVQAYFDTLRLRDRSRLGGIRWLRWER